MVLTQSHSKLHLGDKAPDFRLPGIDGRGYSLDDFSSSQGFLIVFMCNHCPYVKAKIGTIVKLSEKFKGSISVIGINSNDPAYPGEGMDNMKIFAKEYGITFPYLLDDTQEVAKAYGATCTPDPFLFVFEPPKRRRKTSEAYSQKTLVFHGRIDDALSPGDTPYEHTMEVNIQKMLKGKEIDKELKPSMGCSIKWKD